MLRRVHWVLFSVLCLFCFSATAEGFKLSQAEVQEILNTQAIKALEPAPEEPAKQPASKFQRMAKETRNLGIMSLGIMAIIYALPEDVSKWDRSEMTPDKLGDRWVEHNKEGPVWDKDEWNLNMIGHPYFGAAYYVVARNQGLTGMESFGYSALMSTFLWEMGVEAFAETPSRQDLLITPIIGSIVGEGFYIWEQRILDNNGQLWGSGALGSTALLLLNPAGSASKGINRLLGEEENGFIKEANSQLVVQQASTTSHSGEANQPGWVGLRVHLKF
jgi:hypothetical protein